MAKTELFLTTEIARQEREIKAMELKIARGEGGWEPMIAVNRRNIEVYRAELEGRL